MPHNKVLASKELNKDGGHVRSCTLGEGPEVVPAPGQLCFRDLYFGICVHHDFTGLSVSNLIIAII